MGSKMSFERKADDFQSRENGTLKYARDYCTISMF